MRALPLLLLVGCGQTAADAVTPDELHVWGSRGWADGTISRGTGVYDQATQGDALGVGLTWHLDAPPPDLRPDLERIARAVERPRDGSSSPVLMLPGSPSPETPQEASGERSLTELGKAGAALGTLAVGFLAAFWRPGKKTGGQGDDKTPDPPA